MTEAVFRAKCPKLMDAVIRDFGFSVEDAAAIAGNAGHESGGFTLLQELKPTVPGSKGGYGYFQWTGPRRRNFEKFCGEMQLLPSSDAGNISFLIHELKTTERAAVQKTKDAKTLTDKVVAFEKAFERAGVKHYDSRLRWAKIALEAYGKGAVTPPPPDVPGPEPATDAPKGALGKIIAWLVAAGIAAIAAYFGFTPH